MYDSKCFTALEGGESKTRASWRQISASLFLRYPPTLPLFTQPHQIMCSLAVTDMFTNTQHNYLCTFYRHYTSRNAPRTSLTPQQEFLMSRSAWWRWFLLLPAQQLLAVQAWASPSRVWMVSLLVQCLPETWSWGARPQCGLYTVLHFPCAWTEKPTRSDTLPSNVSSRHVQHLGTR